MLPEPVWTSTGSLPTAALPSGLPEDIRSGWYNTQYVYRNYYFEKKKSNRPWIASVSNAAAQTTLRKKGGYCGKDFIR